MRKIHTKLFCASLFGLNETQNEVVQRFGLLLMQSQIRLPAWTLIKCFSCQCIVFMLDCILQVCCAEKVILEIQRITIHQATTIMLNQKPNDIIGCLAITKTQISFFRNMFGGVFHFENNYILTDPRLKKRTKKKQLIIIRKQWPLEEKQSQQTQVQQQNVGQSQQNVQNQGNAQMIQGQVPQQPMMDMGGMEL